MTQTTSAILWQNLIGPDPVTGATATVTAGSTATGFDAERLLDPVVARSWRSANTVNSTHLLFDFGAQVTLRAFALLGTNLTDIATRRVRVSTADTTGAAGDALDTGSGLAGVDEDYRTVGYVHTADVVGRYLRWDLADTDLAWLEAGRAVAGPLTFPEHGFVLPTARGVTGAVRSGRSAGGSQHVTPKWRGRRHRIGLVLTEAEAKGWWHRLRLRNFDHTDVWLVRDVATASFGVDSLWGLVADAQDTTDGDGVPVTALTLEERL